MIAIVVLYIAAVGMFRLAFAGFGLEREIALFLVYAIGGLLVMGVAGPAVYMVLVRGENLDSLGVTSRLWKLSVLGLVLGGLQYLFTFVVTAQALPPDPVDWVPLLVMSLVVGLFEAIFFRGFIQNRLEKSFGLVPSIIGGAGLYSLYHFGYMMDAGGMAFLFGLGIVFAIVFRLTRNILILWPFFTPIGSLFKNIQAGDIALPWELIFGFGVVIAAMGAVLFIAHLLAIKRRNREIRVIKSVRQ